ncbi:MAG TPA: efflux RND transporter periplasmic adaptor subunit [Methylophaga aminisulfidivorans]|uniref:efflux RND transporter periplasmic adaptor subunit n=1 Tax=Methylophaga TaxID=40222 RepID=UPI00177657DE|nr:MULTISPECIES: efflux RND transporter periplasmic adaptor subunit [Methylophaga]HIC47035.1 efflux RND transporter periplasmic adaptor subunit [Methylophaga sp.]HIM39575.1 efflux RND transporter periplasmic adaptor subunit [Methylophaga aminisulfidivorans]
MRAIPLTLLSAFSLMLVACSEPESQAPQQQAKPAEVDVAIPLQHKLTDWDEFTGRFEAISNVNLRARVTGYLIEKKFKDGQQVKKGDVLYVIDPRPFRYELRQIQAQYELAKKELDRAHLLRESNAISQEEVDRRFQELQITEASLNNAKLQLGFTEVTSPIDGKISDSYVDVGNMVEENQTILTRIVSTNPIHFRFEGSQGDLLKYIRLDRAGQRPSSDSSPNPIYIKLMDEDKFYHEGTMHFVDNVVDSATGTIQATATVNNDEGIIYPGLFGRARLLGRANYDAVLVPENAINTDQDKKFVYLIDENNAIKRQYVTVGNLLENDLIVVSTGLTGNEKVVVNGIQRIQASGQEVTPNVVELEWKPINVLGKQASDETTNTTNTDKE